jgi:hypothetical protein
MKNKISLICEIRSYLIAWVIRGWDLGLWKVNTLLLELHWKDFVLRTLNIICKNAEYF